MPGILGVQNERETRGEILCSIPYCITAGRPAKTQVWNSAFALQHDRRVSFCGRRWKLSHMSWTISCVTSVRAPAAAASSPRSSVLT